MGSAAIPDASHPETPCERELSVLANVYRFILDCHLRQETAPVSRLDDAKGDRDHELRAAPNIP